LLRLDLGENKLQVLLRFEIKLAIILLFAGLLLGRRILCFGPLFLVLLGLLVLSALASSFIAVIGVPPRSVLPRAVAILIVPLGVLVPLVFIPVMIARVILVERLRGPGRETRWPLKTNRLCGRRRWRRRYEGALSSGWWGERRWRQSRWVLLVG